MIHLGDLFDVLPTMPEASIAACVTDPPYGLGFMGKQWDTFKPGEAERRIVPNAAAASENPNLKGRTRGPASSPSAVEYDRSLRGQHEFETWTKRWAAEVYRVLKPGAHVLVCGAPRSYHRMASGLEDAGFEIRDCLAWLFGQGFPKSLNFDDGWGTALKPAHEPIVLARKPFKGSIEKNRAQWGTGAINVDACRIDTGGEPIPQFATTPGRKFAEPSERAENNYTVTHAGMRPADLGRWPSNVALDEEAAAMLDEQSGERPSEGGRVSDSGMFGMRAQPNVVTGYGDTGCASRFFYVAKPSRAEREQGCDGLPDRSSFDTVSRDPSSAGANNPRAGAGRTAVLNTAELVYTDPSWVSAVLARRLQADTEASRPKVIGASTIQCSDGSAWSMCWCGSPCTDPYHPAVRSIIETETSWTTALTISNSSRRRHTNGCMAAVFGVMAAGGNPAAYAEFQSPWKRLTGTSRKKAGPSTADVNLATSIASWLTSVPENGGGRRVEGRKNLHPT